MHKAEQKLERIGALQDEARELRHKLSKSLAIQELWPEAFDHGRVRSQWVDRRPAHQRSHSGGQLNHTYRGMRRNGTVGPITEPRPKFWGHIFYVTNGEGEVREYRYEQVPAILGGGL